MGGAGAARRLGADPIVVLIHRPAVHGSVFTGVTGIDPYDEFQYLA